MWLLYQIDESRKGRSLVVGVLSSNPLEFPNKSNVESFIRNYTTGEQMRMVAVNRRANGEFDDEYFLPAADWARCNIFGVVKPLEMSQELRREGMTKSMDALFKGLTEPMEKDDWLAFADAEPGTRKYEWANKKGWSMITLFAPPSKITCMPDGTPTYEFEVYFNHADLKQPFCERYAIPFTAIETTTLM